MAKKGNGNGFFGGFDTVPKSNVDDFDRGFGLDYDFGGKLSKQGREKPLFQDAGFTEEYMRSRDNNAPEAISNNYNDEVSESDIIGSDFTDPKNQQGFQDMLLFDKLDNVNIGKKSTRGVSKDVKLKRRFSRARKQALATGGNPIDPNEERRYSRIGPTRNFGRSAGDGDDLY